MQWEIIQRLIHKGETFPPLFIGFAVGPQSMMPEEFADMHRSISPGAASHRQVRSV